MRRDKLYTINKGNRPIFAQGVDRVNHNIFDGEFGSYMNNTYNPQIGSPLFRNNSTANPFGIALSAPTNSPYINWSSPSQRALALGQTQALANSIGNSNFDLNKSNQQLSNQITTNTGSNKWNDDLTGAVAAGIGTVGTMAGNAIGKGYESGTADAFGTLASTGLGIAGTAMFGPVGGAVGSAIGSVLGGAAHRLIGMKTNREALAKAKAGTSYLNNFKSNAGYFDDIVGPQTQLAITDPYKGGLLKKGKARRLNNALRTNRLTAQKNASAQVENNVDNLVDTQMDTMLANYSAFGGPLDAVGDMGMSAINYDLMTNLINNKRREVEQKNTIKGISPIPNNVFCKGGKLFHSGGCLPMMYALGGDIQNPGSEYSVGKVYNVSEEEANRLKALGYEFTVVS